MRIRLEYKLAMGFTIAIFLILTFVIGAGRNMNSVVEFNQKTNQSLLIMHLINETRGTIFEIEPSSKGYVLTNNPMFLSEYDQSIQKINKCWNSLTYSLKKDSSFINKEILIGHLIQQRIAFSDSLIQMRKSMGDIHSSEFASSEKGERLTSQIDQELGRLENYQYIINTFYNGCENTAAKRTTILFSLLILLIAVILFMVYVFFKKGLIERRKSKKQSKELNENLEKIIHERINTFISKEEELFESKSKLNVVIENSSDSIWSIDKDFQLSSFNNSFFESTKLFYDFEPCIGMPILEYMNAETREVWFQLYQRALNGEHFSEETEDVSIGLELFFDTSFNPIIVNDEIIGVAIFARDISSRKNVERQLEYKIKELNTFMYKATHDLRSPLVSIMGLAQLAKDKKMDEEIAGYFDMIDISVHKMDNLLIDLVKIVNVSQGKLLTEVIDFNSIVDDILLSLSHYPGFSETIFRKQINSYDTFKSDKRLLHSVIQNLIENAMKYKRTLSVTESIIIITIDATAKQAQIGITDNGAGIPEKIQDRVFEMFYRGTTSSFGTGLGLYIVKTSVEKMGGKIMLSSIEGKGTSINITIPNA